ncbi:MAG TPA: SAM-dependent methyltransferase [Mycobacterium sp.]|nr:SAM-dependent methyltransferase [Mycobacterium sp.]
MRESSIVVRPEAPGSLTYTATSRLQAAGLRSAIDLFVRLAQAVPLPDAPHPVVVADYGASTGHNSLLPVGAAIDVLSGRIRKDQAILVTHTDVAENDFTVLFQTLANDPDSYLRRHPAAFPAAIGRSFYSQILPSDSVTLGWSSWGIHWLSRPPGPVGDDVLPAFSTEETVRAACARQGAADWHEFIAFRGRELVPNGRLMVLTLGRDESGEFGMQPLIDHLGAALHELADAGVITTQERQAMTIPVVGRNEKDIIAPFFPKGRFEGLTIEHLEVSDAEDRFWQQFQVDGDASAFASKWAGFLRASVFGCLVDGLSGGSGDPRVGEFCDRLERQTAARLAVAPQKMRITQAKVVLVKNRPR